jgi:Tetratricopeptide repeat
MVAFKKTLDSLQPKSRFRFLLSIVAVAITLAALRQLFAQDLPIPIYRNTLPGVAYVGDDVCRSCHLPQFTEFKATGMGRSLSIPVPTNWPEFRKPVTLSSRQLDRVYTVTVNNGKMYHAESQIGPGGKAEYSERHEVAFTVGSGDLGRSYLVFKGDSLFLSPISYYAGVHRWDLSPGYEERRYRSFTRPVWLLCAYCHSGLPQPVDGSRNQYKKPPFRFLTIACERCHGPGEVHIRERRQVVPLEGPLDLSIVNPARLRYEIRNDVCNQCHFIGDARVLRSGKSVLDFRPGTPLGETVAIFTASLGTMESKDNVVKALGHEEQLEYSRCWQASKSKLSCITCHAPHSQPRGDDAASYFRQKCLRCHNQENCTGAPERRQATLPRDNCIQCHMPKRKVVGIGHSALTDHGIPRFLDQVEGLHSQGEPSDLVYRTRLPNLSDQTPDLRTFALAYFEASQIYPSLQPKGFELLKQAASEFPHDPEVQSAYGLVLTAARPNAAAEAALALQSALDAGSKSVEVKTRLAHLRLREGKTEVALQLYNEAIASDPYYSPAYFGLASLYISTGNRPKGIDTLRRILVYDPGNDEARRAIGDASSDPDH